MPFVWFFARVPFMTIWLIWLNMTPKGDVRDLGFHLKWNMGFTYDAVSLFGADFDQRPQLETFGWKRLAWSLGAVSPLHGEFSEFWFSQCLGGWTSWTSIGRLALRKKKVTPMWLCPSQMLWECSAMIDHEVLCVLNVLWAFVCPRFLNYAFNERRQPFPSQWSKKPSEG